LLLFNGTGDGLESIDHIGSMVMILIICLVKHLLIFNQRICDCLEEACEKCAIICHGDHFSNFNIMDFFVLYIDKLITLTADTWQPYCVDKAKSKKTGIYCYASFFLNCQ
jgi:hypothetical protein